MAILNPARSPLWPAPLDEHAEGHATAEITYLLGRELELVVCV
jgi:hypothetical protein